MFKKIKLNIFIEKFFRELTKMASNIEAAIISNADEEKVTKPFHKELKDNGYESDQSTEETDIAKIVAKMDISEYTEGKYKKFLPKKVRRRLDNLVYNTAFDEAERPLTIGEYDEFMDVMEAVEEERDSTDLIGKGRKLDELLIYLRHMDDINGEKMRRFNDWKQKNDVEDDVDEEEVIEDYLEDLYEDYYHQGGDYEDDADDAEYS